MGQRQTSTSPNAVMQHEPVLSEGEDAIYATVELCSVRVFCRLAWRYFSVTRADEVIECDGASS